MADIKGKLAEFVEKINQPGVKLEIRHADGTVRRYTRDEYLGLPSARLLGASSPKLVEDDEDFFVEED